MGTLSYIKDGLRNALTGIGTSRDPRQAGYYASTAMTQHMVDQAYRGSGLMRKIIQIPAMDMVREWRDFKLPSDQIPLVEAEEKRHMLRQKIKQVEMLRDMGGGALIMGLPGDPSQPAPATVGKGGLAYVHVVSRWHLTFSDVQQDARVSGYGEPIMWRMCVANGNADIHPSRVIPFRADTAISLVSPAMSSLDDQFWGESVISQVLDAVKDSDTARASFASIMHKARVLRIGIPGLMDLVASPGGEANVMARLSILAQAEGIHNAVIFDAGNADGKEAEQITDAQYNFAGARDMLSAYAEFVSAVSDIPATRLLGRAPEGMNSSGDSQQADWRKKIRARQTLDLSPCLDRLDAYLVPSALGSMPPEYWYDFAPLDTPGEKENADRFNVQMQAVDKLMNMGLVPDRALSKGVQSLLIEEGYLPEIEAALADIPDEERYGIDHDMSESDLSLDPNSEGGDPNAWGEDLAKDAAPRSLYVSRKLLNGDEFIKWAKSQGFDQTLSADDMHVTVAYSRLAVDWMEIGQSWSGDNGELLVSPGGARIVEPLGNKGAVVLLFNSSELAWRHEEMKRAGASWDYPEYQPHVTITYEGSCIDLAGVEPYRGALHFGPEIFEELDEDWKATEA